MRPTLTASLSILLLVACSSGGAAGGGRSTDDARVRSYLGQTAPELPSDGRWIGGNGSLAALRGRIVYVQFAFPT